MYFDFTSSIPHKMWMPFQHCNCRFHCFGLQDRISDSTVITLGSTRPHDLLTIPEWSSQIHKSTTTFLCPFHTWLHSFFYVFWSRILHLLHCRLRCVVNDNKFFHSFLFNLHFDDYVNNIDRIIFLLIYNTYFVKTRLDRYTLISTKSLILPPSLTFSFLRTSALSGRRYAPDFLSGKIDVFQLVLPIVTVTGSEPQPRDNTLNFFLMPSDCFLGRVMKCH